jgi:hypothetical protein
MVVLLDKNPQRNHADIGREVGLSDQAVRKWRTRWCEDDFSLQGKPRSGRPAVFSPGDVAEVKVAACEAVRETNLPLSKQSTADLARRLPERLGKPISRSTVGRMLEAAVIKPWQHRSWIFPRAADFAEKAEVILDLYALGSRRPTAGVSGVLHAVRQVFRLEARPQQTQGLHNPPRRRPPRPPPSRMPQTPTLSPFGNATA